jgi:MFS family permease
LRRLLADRDARVLLTGETLSMFGDRALFLVLAVWAKSLTGSSAAAGLVFFVFAAPSLAAPLAGLLVDRLPRRAVMIATDCFAGSAVLLLLLVHDRGDLWLIYLVAGLYGAASSVFSSAQSALLTVMLPRDLLPDANAAFQSVREAQRLIAPLAGAGIYAAVGGGAVAVLDAATFGVSALCLLALRVREQPAPPPEHAFLRELAAGIRHVVHTLPIRQIVIATGGALLVVGFSETLLFSVIDQGLHRSPSFMGVLSSVQGVGAIAGGLTAAAVLRRIGDVRLAGIGILLFALGDLAFVSSSLPVVVAGMVVAGVGISWLIVGFGTALQTRTPAHLQGRVFSAADTMVGLPQTISIGLGAGLSTLVDYRLLVLAMAGGCTVFALYLLTRAREPADEIVADEVAGAVGFVPPEPLVEAEAGRAPK